MTDSTIPHTLTPGKGGIVTPRGNAFSRTIGLITGVGAIAGGIVSFSGWVLDIPRLTDWFASGISMFPNAALCAAVSGAAVLLFAQHIAEARRNSVAKILGTAVALVGGITLVEHISGWDLRIDRLLMERPWGQRAAAAPMRMGPPASLSFFILGVGFVLAAGRSSARRLASYLAGVPIAIAFLSILGYWFGTDELYAVENLTGIALQTSILIATLAIGLMSAVPESGLFSLLGREDAGGMLVRQLLLPIILLPPLLGWLRVLGEQAGLFDEGFGRSILLFVMTVMLLALLLSTASSISRAGGALREREQRYELVLAGTEAAIWDWDVVNKRVLFSPRWKELRGLTSDEVSDSEQEWIKGIHLDDYERVMASVQAHFDGATDFFAEEYRVRHKSGHWIWILDRGIARRDATSQVIQMAGSETDITERKQLEDELRSRLEELAEADRRKNEFLATLAHELRNPLAPIRNALHILHRIGTVDPTKRSMLEMMERQVTHMVRLVDDLLEVSRISSGKISLRTQHIDIAEAINNALETCKPLIEASGHQLEVSLPAEPLTVLADSVRLSQVVANLLNNAAKYTEPGGAISLTAARRDQKVTVTVRDTGVGIPPEMLPHLFRMFAQADKDHKRAQGGLGIGLALAKSLIEMQGGQIEVFSGGEGKGSEFMICLPLVQAPTERGEKGSEPPGSNGEQAGFRVLVVDDNQDAASSLALVLKLLGHEVQTAHDGTAALAAAKSFRPAVVFLDLGMPGMSGFEVAELLRDTDAGRRAVLVALTGWGQEEDRRRTREAGFHYHLVKPVEIQSLETVLSNVPAENAVKGASKIEVS